MMYLYGGPGARAQRIVTAAFSQADATASQTDVALARDGANDTARLEYVAHRAGSLVGIAIAVEGARTAGTLTLNWTLDGVQQTLALVIDGTNTQYHQVGQGVGAETFAAAQRIGVDVTTDGTWAAGVTPSISVELLLHYDQ